MIVGVPKETFPGERRVALVPSVAPTLIKSGIQVTVEAGAGAESTFRDEAYQEKGARLAESRGALFREADVIVQVRGLGVNRRAGRMDLELLRRGQLLIGLQEPFLATKEVGELASTGVTLFALDLMPRITRAQPMDVLTSMATVAGYKAVLLAAAALPRMFPLLMTAAGTITPAKVLIVGAGVAGLQAVATARRLGAMVRVYDMRPEVKEQAESLGARFVALGAESGETTQGGYARPMDEAFHRRQQEILAGEVRDSDVVIAAANVPGARAPVLITAEAVRAMRPGSVIVDLAAERGGNCQLTLAGETVVVNGVSVMGPVDLASTIPHDASQMYSKNITSFLLHLAPKGQLKLNQEDEIIKGTLVACGGQIVHPRLQARQAQPVPTGR